MIALLLGLAPQHIKIVNDAEQDGGHAWKRHSLSRQVTLLRLCEVFNLHILPSKDVKVVTRRDKLSFLTPINPKEGCRSGEAGQRPLKHITPRPSLRTLGDIDEEGHIFAIRCLHRPCQVNQIELSGFAAQCSCEMPVLLGPRCFCGPQRLSQLLMLLNPSFASSRSSLHFAGRPVFAPLLLHLVKVMKQESVCQSVCLLSLSLSLLLSLEILFLLIVLLSSYYCECSAPKKIPVRRRCFW